MFFLVYFRQIDMEMTKRAPAPAGAAGSDKINEERGWCQDFIMQKIDAQNQ